MNLLWILCGSTLGTAISHLYSGTHQDQPDEYDIQNGLDSAQLAELELT